MTRPRAASFARPFLERARRVIVLTVESGMVPGPTGEQVALWLRRNGIAAEAMTAPADRRGPGETILAQAASLGCDLLVKGAYTQSRLRQMIFGARRATSSRRPPFRCCWPTSLTASLITLIFGRVAFGSRDIAQGCGPGLS